jgi:hypothetical protein
MANNKEPSQVELWFRHHPKVMITLWIVLVIIAAFSLMFVGYAAPTLYEGF